MNKRWTPSVTVAAVVEREGRFLLVEEHTPEGLKLNNPAGHLEPGETPEAAVVREALEETGREFAPEALLGVYIARFVRPRPARPQRPGRPPRRSGEGGAAAAPRPPEDITYLRFAYRGRVSEPLPERTLDPAIVRTVWLTRDEIAAEAARLRSPLVLRCIDDHLAGRAWPLDAVATDPSLLDPIVLQPLAPAEGGSPMAESGSPAAADPQAARPEAPHTGVAAAQRPSRSARRRAARQRMASMQDNQEVGLAALATAPGDGTVETPDRVRPLVNDSAHQGASGGVPAGPNLGLAEGATEGATEGTTERTTDGTNLGANDHAKVTPLGEATLEGAQSQPTPGAPAAPPRREPTLAETAQALAERFPALFALGQPRPIKLRIQADIQTRSQGAFTRKQLSIFLHRHTTSTAYLRALVATPQRFDLDGQPAGEVLPEHVEAAKTELERRRQIVMQRRGLAAGPGAAPGSEPAGPPVVPGTPTSQTGERPPRPPRPPRPGPSPREGAPGRRAHTDRPPRTEQAAGHSGPDGRPARAERPPGAEQRPGRPGPVGQHGRPDRPDRPNRTDRPERTGGGPWRGQDRGADRGDRPFGHSPQKPQTAMAEETVALPEDPERRERAMLLRSFEGSPLTAANFCALKGLALDDFEVQIARARHERKERQRGTA